MIEKKTKQVILVDSVKFYIYTSKDYNSGGSPITVLEGTVDQNGVYSTEYTIPSDAMLGDYIVKIVATKGDYIATDFMKFRVVKVDL